MYNNSGEKIKDLVSLIVIVQMIAWVAIGLILMYLMQNSMLIGFIIMIIGCFSAWVSSLFLYAFGELVDKAICIEKHLITDKNSLPVDNQSSVVTQIDEKT